MERGRKTEVLIIYPSHQIRERGERRERFGNLSTAGKIS
jgi:hypothetical protein